MLLFAIYAVPDWWMANLCSRIHLHAYGFYYRYYGDVVKSSIYSYLENDLGLKIQSAHRIARADMPTEQEKKWLDIGDQVLPVLEVEQVAYLDDGRILSTLFPVTGQIDLNLKV